LLRDADAIEGPCVSTKHLAARTYAVDRSR
jgi:hypothetical protein